MSLKEIISGSIDVYSFLNVAPTAQIVDIRRLYRRMALEYHPDKDPSPEAARKFHILSQVFEILSDSKLRSEYDRLREIQKRRNEALEETDEDVKRFKRELERSERENAVSKKAQAANNELELEILREEGYRMRRHMEKEKQRGDLSNDYNNDHMITYNSYRDIDCGPLISLENDIESKLVHGESGVTNLSSNCTIKWKYKAELESLLTEDILAEIMSIFGPVRKVIKHANVGDNYSSGMVEFEDVKDAQRASQHNYRSSAKKWDHTRVRKLASLLRGCKLEDTAEQGSIEKFQKKLSAGNRHNQKVIVDIMNGSGVLDNTLREVLMSDG